VVLGFLTPATAFYAREATGQAISDQLGTIASSEDRELSEATVLETSRLSREAASPLTRMESHLHPWSAFVILPLFALSNAGVPISLDDLTSALTGPVGLGIALGLVIGAPLGGFLLAWLLARTTPARLSERLDWPAIAGVAPLKGIGFTVAIFISELAFAEQAIRDQAKLAILVASVAAAVIGLTVLFLRSRGTEASQDRESVTHDLVGQD
jgi:NhaA family Na+:H+ antiporter